MSWRNIKLSEVIIHRKEFITIDNSVEYKRCRVQVNKKGVILRDIIKGILINTKKQQLCKAGDFLVAEIDAKVGGYGFVPQELEGAIVSSHYFLFDIDETKMLKDYLALIIKTDILQAQISSKGSTNYAAIRPSHVLNFEIPLPNIDEQIKLVKRLNKISKEYLAIETEFGLQQNYLKLLRQAIMQEAVQGKLTQQNKTDEPAEKLLQRIKAEKKKLIVAGKLKKEKELQPVTKDEIPFELPKGWVWCRLGEIGQINPRNNFEDTKDASFIPMTLISSEFEVSPKFEIRKWKDIKSGFTHFAENDVAVAKITPCFENSKAGIFKGLINGIGAGTTELHIFRGNEEYILSKYIYLFFKTPNFLKEGESRMTGSAGQKRIPSDYIKSSLFPLPPYSEQHRIVTKVQQLLQMINLLEQQVVQSQTQAQQLLQAVLKEAFTKNNSAQIIEITQSTIAPRKILAGHIIQLCNSSKYFGHTTFHKNLYLCETHAKITAYETNYVKDRAGPFDKDFFFPFLKEMENEEWFYEEQKGSITYFRTGEKVGKLVKDYATHFRQYNNEIRFVLQLMKDKTTDESELVATIYAVWNNHLILKKELNDSTLIEEVYDWSSSKIKFTKNYITNTWQWMKEQNFIPHGWGRLIEKNNKK